MIDIKILSSLGIINKTNDHKTWVNGSYNKQIDVLISKKNDFLSQVVEFVIFKYSRIV